ncbi:hypothetical protein B0F90DRAFT_1396762 [Multifurca ochricompacta]|uniref:Uncharacterized protein n=1 Tax=Multifurca ochricompacta TaxID=376703 RepID=A0AAD4LXL9_9AGAM|nr:hypothetical protein B0F90DRAFT_1396762 [Multifurca ochricompacta]
MMMHVESKWTRPFLSLAHNSISLARPRQQPFKPVAGPVYFSYFFLLGWCAYVVQHAFRSSDSLTAVTPLTGPPRIRYLAHVGDYPPRDKLIFPIINLGCVLSYLQTGHPMRRRRRRRRTFALSPNRIHLIVEVTFFQRRSSGLLSCVVVPSSLISPCPFRLVASTIFDVHIPATPDMF